MKRINVDKKLIVGFDMDGVILDNAGSKMKVAKKLGFTIKLSHTPSEILRTLMPQIVLEEFQSILYNHPSFAFSSPLMRGVRGILDDFKKRNINYFLISRRKMPDVAIKILHKHALWPKHFNENNSFFVGEPKDKNKQAVKLGITHFIDDELVNIDALSKVPNKFLFDQFGVFKDGEHYTRVTSWSEFKKHISKI